jgi:hypothetical protein
LHGNLVMELILKNTENLQTFDIYKGESEILDGLITNRSSERGFVLQTEDYKTQYSSDELRAIADKLDELNKR